mgnify:FL=1
MFKETFTALAIVAGLVATGAQAREGSDRMQERFGQIDANGDGQITVEELNAQAAARFAAVDADGNGALSPEEMTFGKQGRRSARLLERFDTDKDGSLSAAELAAMDNEPQERAVKHFERMDADKSGDLSPEELQGRRDPAKMIARLDTDKNGSLSTEEFAKMRGHGKHMGKHMGKDKKDRAAD